MSGGEGEGDEEGMIATMEGRHGNGSEESEGKERMKREIGEIGRAHV